jgi:hypothetical protein
MALLGPCHETHVHCYQLHPVPLGISVFRLYNASDSRFSFVQEGSSDNAY